MNEANKYCDSCYSCDHCYSCCYCYYSKNIKMTEHNIFCYSKKHNDESSFQQERYRAFNKVVGEKRYNEIKKEVRKILGEPKINLFDFWMQVTSHQWSKLISIPEAKDFKEGFEYISGIKINKIK